MEKIVILNTNDIHSHFENWPKIRRYLVSEKRAVEKKGKTCLTLDLGDFSDRVHPYTEASNGLFNTELMNEIGFDGVTIGNNEGIGNSFSQLNQLYSEANFDVIVANLFEKKTNKRPSWAKPYKIIITSKGTKIGLIGLTAAYPLTYEPNGWTIHLAKSILPTLLVELSSNTDVIILMSHLGLKEDQLLAEMFPEIDLILGSHTHHLLSAGVLVNNVLLTGAGKFGQYVGLTHLDLEKHQIVAKETKIINVSELKEKASDNSEVAGYWEKGDELLASQPIAFLQKGLGDAADFYNDLVKETLEALKNYAGVDAAIINSGLFLKSLEAGFVTKKDLHECLPHPMRIIKVTLTGSDLFELLVDMDSKQEGLLNHPIEGMGFRGKIFGQLVLTGITFDRQEKSIYWQGNPILPSKIYSFATVDHLLFIPQFPIMSKKGQVEFLFPEFLREVLGQYLSEHYPC
ncbi:bifunctional metallophosphatase/5'-nucleotidase [Vagococcus intermedius]|uniref:5'-nucleotidase C-terminal domain-containing protein n=1 Tax=Vagococcus intermedius TaxID=2991418 RepID=A0AAF0CTY8_9ENTE|nr:bifunctional metallophosphatase/5'-nucleotidase [Vagococcus intermedius]WEG72918.1 5'-nucleotidase C-terminal domain-containing protein [Vagococcus intermedius]WEG75005.1 5'-nucleotidase C-terminal domain-containing protein [Vagococcus intermedius]